MTELIEIKIARYALTAILLVSIINFYASINAMAKSSEYGTYPSLLSGYDK